MSTDVNATIASQFLFSSNHLLWLSGLGFCPGNWRDPQLVETINDDEEAEMEGIQLKPYQAIKHPLLNCCKDGRVPYLSTPLARAEICPSESRRSHA